MLSVRLPLLARKGLAAAVRLLRVVVGLSSGLWIDRLRESWVKDLAKEAAVEDGPVVYDKMPREVILTQQKENGLHMFKRQWTDTVKGAVTKVFFPVGEE